MILASSTKASYSGNRDQKFNSETDYFVSDEFVFWEKKDPKGLKNQYEDLHLLSVLHIY